MTVHSGSSTAAGFTLAGMLRELAAARPHAPAVSFEDRTIDFATLHARSSQVAQAFRRTGVGEGDRVAILDKNAPTFYDVVFGAAKLGAATIGLNFRLAAPELAAILADAEPKLTVVAPEFRHLLPAELDVVELGDEFEKWRAAEQPDDPEIAVDPEAVALQLYSSGTTGKPKGAMLTHANLAWTPRMGREFYGMSSESVNLVPSPLFHIGGVGYGLTTMGQGGHTVLVRDVDPAALLEAIARHGVTHTFVVPSVIQMLVEHPGLPGTDLSSMVRIAYGGAPMGEAQLLRAIEAFGCDFMGVYGMTETTGTVIALDPADHDPGGPRAHLLRSVGRGLPWLSVRVVDPVSGRDSPIGTVGEIWVRGGQNMAGYWKQPVLTADALVEGGWLRTGDAAYLDSEGYVYMHDRIKDMIVSGGENIYPAEVENTLYGHPDVSEVAVIGVPSVKWGETVKAMVVPRSGATIDEPALLAWTRDRLAHYKCPTSIDFIDLLPRNASGKILKHQLRAPFWAGRERAVH
ncbi:fatty acid--CoA ligase [Amycolatopsis ultiminotia]|uniref:Fatty acid--CoA ligase n=1 Tax=Amycolatopsis ultiminotia TaxID=543629 RepID=A0ABP6UYS6_9PSEU